MGFTVNFMDNRSVSAADINAVAASIDSSVTQSESSESNTDSTESNTESSVSNAESTVSNAELSVLNIDSSVTQSESSESNTDSTESNTESTVSNADSTESNTESTVSNAELSVLSIDSSVTQSESSESNTDSTESNTESTVSNADSTVSNTESTVSNTDSTVSNAESTVSNADSTVTQSESFLTQSESSAESTVFADGVVYGVDELNAITKSLITKGVSQGCSVSCDGEKVTINAGIAFFSDGKKVTIDTDGIILTRNESFDNYVYFFNDTVTGTVSAKCTQAAPAGDYIMLCEISANGTVTPKKDVALMKNPSLLPNSYVTENIHVTASESSVWVDFEYELSGNYRRMVMITREHTVYYNWDTMKCYLDGYSHEYDIGGEIVEVDSGTTYKVRLVSFENNILKGQVRSYGDVITRQIRLECM